MSDDATFSGTYTSQYFTIEGRKVFLKDDDMYTSLSWKAGSWIFSDGTYNTRASDGEVPPSGTYIRSMEFHSHFSLLRVVTDLLGGSEKNENFHVKQTTN